MAKEIKNVAGVLAMRCTKVTTTTNGARLHMTTSSLFEFLLLEGAQAGLSWITILKKREGYRKAFDGFEAEKVARIPTCSNQQATP